jgi:predicted transposase/invertase (TIGR01784 family)
MDLLLAFLKVILRNRKRITGLHYLESEHLGKTKVSRGARFDIYCETESGAKIVVEMQSAYQKYFKDRSVLYAAHAVLDQAQKGEDWNYKLKPVYVVGILNFVVKDHIDTKEYYRQEIKLMDELSMRVDYNKLIHFHIEMPKFNKTESELRTDLDKWLYALKRLPELDEQPAKLSGPIFDRLFKAAEIANFTRDEIWEYESNLKACRDSFSQLEGAVYRGEKRGLKKGRKEGLEKGEAIGLEKGEAIGLEKGRKQAMEENIRTCNRNGMSIEQIKTFFALSHDKVLEILS